MAKISSTEKQFTITIPKDLMKILGSSMIAKVIISKFPDKKKLFIEKIEDNSDG